MFPLCSGWVVFNQAAPSRHSACLEELAELSMQLLRKVHRLAMETEGKDFVSAALLCNDIAKGVRLSIALERRVMSCKPDQVRVEASEPRDPETRERRSEVERDRERERESDSFPMTVLGRAEAFLRLLTRNPDIDPDGRVTAQVIQIKAYLSGKAPDPDPPPTRPKVHPTSEPIPFTQPTNRAERCAQQHRLRRSSG